MLKINISGADEASKYFTKVQNDLIPTLLDGIESALIMLEVEIESKARQAGKEEYAESVIAFMNRPQMYGIVGPSIEYAPIEEMGRVAAFVHARCPWWKYLEPKLRARVPSFPMLQQIAIEKTDEIKAIIVNKLREVFRK